jgi:hypothetical protein
MFSPTILNLSTEPEIKDPKGLHERIIIKGSTKVERLDSDKTRTAKKIPISQAAADTAKES